MSLLNARDTYQESRRLDADQKFSKQTLMKADAKAVEAWQQQRVSARVSRCDVDIGLLCSYWSMYWLQCRSSIVSTGIEYPHASRVTALMNAT